MNLVVRTLAPVGGGQGSNWEVTWKGPLGAPLLDPSAPNMGVDN